MRCKNCGWDNPDSNVRCEKCNAPLEGSITDRREVRTYALPASESIRLNETVREPGAFGGSSQYPSPEEKKTGPESCPECGYRIRTNEKSCPSCGQPLSRNFRKRNTGEEAKAVSFPRKNCPSCHAGLPFAANFCPSCGTSLDNNSSSKEGTINPWTTDGNHPACTLTPLAREHETAALSPLSFSGSRIILTRSNTEPGNQTITSGEQAALTCEPDGWHIEDRSVQKTTFVHASGKKALKPGDMIILGNRSFIFNEQATGEDG
jgi:hypothetical protein